MMKMDNEWWKTVEDSISEAYLNIAHSGDLYKKFSFSSEDSEYVGYTLKSQLFTTLLPLDVVNKHSGKSYSTIVSLSSNADENRTILSKLMENDTKVVSAMEWLLSNKLINSHADIRLCYDFHRSTPEVTVRLWHWT